MHRNLALATVVLAAFGWALAFSPAQKRKLDYFDPEDRRVHAAVDAIVEDGRLQLVVSALGARVEPLPGFRGRMGANLQTAFEIDQLFAGGRLQMVTLDSTGQQMPSGEMSPGRQGRVPVRRLRHDGTIDYLAMSARKYLLDLKDLQPFQIVHPVMLRLAWIQAIEHPRAQDYLAWLDAEVQKGSASLREQIAQMKESSYNAEKAASEERRKRFERMSTKLQSLAAKYAGAESQ